MTDEPTLPRLTTAAELKKAIVDAVAPIMSDVQVRALLDVDTQQLHVQLTGKRLTYEEVRQAIEDKLKSHIGRKLAPDWPPQGGEDQP